MNRQHMLALGLAAGAGAALIGVRLARARRRISFAGRVVVITGGSRGLGLVMARMFADEGARVFRKSVVDDSIPGDHLSEQPPMKTVGNSG